ncbi:MAG: M20/M25/M40 family metallo-hydrolase [Candidatus Eremiobacteraeota bacterium]|nr:M20/M25/M40 family metallo-hydrolase [Candidatus Eremiobacteraeota bacterium]
MKSCAAFFAALLCAPLLAAAPQPTLSPPPVDPQIASLVNAISADRLRESDTKLVGFFTRNDFSETSSTATRGVFGARDWIRSEFEHIAGTTAGRMSVTLDTYLQPKTAKTPRAVTESSIIATLRGDEPGPLYIMSSHYDDCNGDCTNGTRVAPGADDNGSGTSAVLEAARVMAPHHFRGTIVFAVFDGEELGLWGSQHYANALKAAGTQVAANLNNDIIGNTQGGGGAREPGVIRVFSEALPAGTALDRVNLVGSENDSPSRELARYVGEVVPQYVPDFSVREIWRADRFLRGGDQESFQADGYPAIRFVESNENFTHQHQDVRLQNGVQYGDLPVFMDWDYLKRATQANVAALASLASAPLPPANAQLITHKLGYDSTLRWQPSPGAASYEIVWRATDAPQWQFAKNFGNVTEATVPVSKDDYILGVRAIGAQGHRSVVSYPTPVRE